MHYWQRYLCFTMTCVTPYSCLDTFLLLIFPNITLFLYSLFYGSSVHHGYSKPWCLSKHLGFLPYLWIWCCHGCSVWKKNPQCDPYYTLIVQLKTKEGVGDLRALRDSNLGMMEEVTVLDWCCHRGHWIPLSAGLGSITYINQLAWGPTQSQSSKQMTDAKSMYS